MTKPDTLPIGCLVPASVKQQWNTTNFSNLNFSPLHKWVSVTNKRSPFLCNQVHIKSDVKYAILPLIFQNKQRN